jgi:hypothetical protein
LPPAAVGKGIGATINAVAAFASTPAGEATLAAIAL